MLINIEDEETIRACDLPKPEHPRSVEAELKPRQMIAWLESDSEGAGVDYPCGLMDRSV